MVVNLDANQRRVLLQILTERFSPDELRTVAFLIGGRGTYDDLSGSTFEAKAVSLLEFLAYRRRIVDLIDFIKDCRPDIDLSELETEPEPEPPQRVEFVNRVSEIQRITDRRAPQYQLVDAPAGYGKTELLKEIVKHYRQEGWLCVYVEVPRAGAFSIEDVVTAIAEVGECDLGDGQPRSDVAVWAQRMGFRIAGCLLQYLQSIQRLRRVRAEGVILLLDNIEMLEDGVAKLVLNSLVPSIHDGLKRAGIQSPFRALFAGRYISRGCKELAPFISSSILLTPFTFAVVKDTVEEHTQSIGVALGQQDVARVASHLMYLTGGHPGCMAEILRQFNLDWLAADDALLGEEADHFENVISPVAEAVRTVELRDKLDTLSPCRRFTPRVLRGLIGRKLLQHVDEYALEEELTRAYLATRKSGFLQDDITRRLLTIRLRQRQPDHLVEVCEASREIYAEMLADPRTTRPEMVAIELLFQELQLGTYQNRSNTPAERAALAATFFDALPRHLQTLVAERDARHMLPNLVAALDDDWEFQFTINYFLREDAYDERPYTRLRQEVGGFVRHP